MYKLMADHTVSKGSTCITDPKGILMTYILVRMTL